MNTLRKQILVAFAAVGFAGAAFAQTAATPVQEGRHGHAVTAEQRAAHQAKRAEFRAKHAERQAARAAKLRADLKLSAQQEPAFAAFLAAGKPAGRPQVRDGAERARFAALPAPQRMERIVERQKQRTARMEARLAALNNFYAVLTPEQKKVFDSQAMRGGFGKHRGHGPHGARAAAMPS